MSNGGGRGGRAQELRSSDLWGRQLISERRTFIFLEAESSPGETNSTVPMWSCLCVCVITRGPGVTHLEGMCTWTPDVGVWAWFTDRSELQHPWLCVVMCAPKNNCKAVCTHPCPPAYVCTHPCTPACVCTHPCPPACVCTLCTVPPPASGYCLEP